MILMTFFSGYNKSNYLYIHMYIITVDLIIIHVAMDR